MFIFPFRKFQLTGVLVLASWSSNNHSRFWLLEGGCHHFSHMTSWSLGHGSPAGRWEKREEDYPWNILWARTGSGPHRFCSHSIRISREAKKLSLPLCTGGRGYGFGCTLGYIYFNIYFFWLPWVFAAAPGLSLIAESELPVKVASLVAEHGLQGVWASVVVAFGLSCPEACGIFLNWGSNLYPLH